MIKEFILPDLGEGIVECEVVDWLVAEGDWVEEDQAICEVMTDKALVQIPAKEAGKISQLYYQQGQLAQVHAPLFALEVVSECEHNAPENSAADSANSGTTQAEPHLSITSQTEPLATEPTPARQQRQVLASPAVRRLAREHQLDLSKIHGSGRSGRIYKHDIERYLQQSDNQQPDLPAPHLEPQASTLVTDSGSEPSFQYAAKKLVEPSRAQANKVQPIIGLQAVMAKQMSRSAQTIPHFTYCDELELTQLLQLRTDMNAQSQHLAQAAMTELSLMPFFIKALSLALLEYPLFNSRVNADCSEITYLSDHNIGMAVAGKLGLLVPNVKQVQNKSIVEINDEVMRLKTAGRQGRVSPNDLKQGTITLSNIGAIGGTLAVPIINPPEVAIVALGKLQTLPRVNAQGVIEAHNVMQVSWSGDHRVIDGAAMAHFCNAWKHYLEHPSCMLMFLR